MTEAVPIPVDNIIELACDPAGTCHILFRDIVTVLLYPKTSNEPPSLFVEEPPAVKNPPNTDREKVLAARAMLGIESSESLTLRLVKSQFRNKSYTCHPDRQHPNPEWAANEFRKRVDAKEFLEKRIKEGKPT